MTMSGGGGSSGSLGASDVAGAINTIVAMFWHKTQGSGRMAARGAQAQAMKIDAMRYLIAQREAQHQNAFAEFARTNPFEAGFLVENVSPDAAIPAKLVNLLGKTTAKMEKLARKPQTSKVLAKERKLQAKLAKQEVKLTPYTESRVAELKGANAGYWRERGAPPPLWLTQRRI